MEEMKLIKQIIKPEDHSLADFDKKRITKDYFSERLTEDEIIQVLGRKWKTILPKIYFIAKKFEWAVKYEPDYLIPFNIWQTDERFSVLGSQRHISTIIEKACDIKLLSCVHDSYVFGKARKNSREDDSKWYVMDKLCYSIVDKLCNRDDIVGRYNDLYNLYTISRTIRESLNNNQLEECLASENNDISMFRFSSNLKIKTSLSDEAIELALYKNYPQLLDTYNDINYVNEKYLCNSTLLERQFKPNIERNSKGNIVKKISIRDCSRASSLKTHFNSDEDRLAYNGLTREQFLEQYFGGKEGDKYYEYDVKSSIYRITYFINKGIWLDESIDLYSMIYGDEFDTPELRERYKRFCMSIYFDSDSLKTIRVHMLHNKKAYDVDSVEKDELLELLRLSREKMNYAIGNRLGSEVFMHESCIYAKLNRSLWDKGFRTVQIYDGFYTQCNGLTREEYNKMCSEEIRRITEEYKQKYLQY